MGAEGSRDGAVPALPEKNEFLPETGGF